jgi:SAM-dependent methyltransferase
MRRGFKPNLRWKELKEGGNGIHQLLRRCHRANAYATLEFANTYYLAYRDLPVVLAEHVIGERTLDFGCGTGRSTRFLRNLGFNVIDVDIADDMLRIARSLDSSGNYRLVPEDNLTEFAPETFNLIVSLFTFDNVPGTAKIQLFSDLRESLAPAGTIVSVVSSPEIYIHEWASFTTGDFQRMKLRVAVMSRALSLQTTMIGGLSKTSSGLMSRIERCIEKRVCRRSKSLDRWPAATSRSHG